ncbi:MAG TPA: MFS transporter [Kofleriaceae bacterium]|nr:MFS transporter [Kofleriaceae bacterium]
MKSRKRDRFTAPNIVLGMLCVMYFLTYVDRVNLSTASSAIQKEFALSPTQLGFVLSAFAYPYAALQVIGGWVGDQLGARRTLFLCGTVWALATATTGLATGMVSLVVFRMLLGLGEGATFPTATRAMQSWTPVGRRGFAQGVTHAFSRLGNTVTPVIVTALMAWWSWRGAFVVLGAASMVWVVAWWLYYRDDPKDHAGITKADLASLPPHGAPKKTTVPWRRLTLRILPVTLTYFCYGWTLWLMLTWLPQFLQKQFSIDLKQSAIYLTIVYFFGFIGDSVGGIVSDYLLHRTGRLTFSRLVVIVPGMLCAAAFTMPVLFSRDLVTVTICLSGAFFFLELVIGPIWAVPMDIAPKYSGMASGLMNTGSAVAAIVSPLAFGYIVQVTGGWSVPFYGSVGLLLIGTVLAFTMRPDRKFVDEPELPRAKVETPAG